jgi:hypothetical protein
MKRNFKIMMITAFLVIAPLLMLAQTPPHPNGGAAPGPGNNPVGAGAPVGSGAFILITLSAAYAARKVYVMRTSTVTK